jgi:uncharacterized FAD-dependent dehydrogenase
MPPGYTEEDLKRKIEKELRTADFSYRIDSKSLDARKKTFIHWLIRIGITSPAQNESNLQPVSQLDIPKFNAGKKAIVAGSGPAGFFAALILQQAGIQVTILERGAEVDDRATRIKQFEQGGAFDPAANYAFGEGGAGTFSDGKLTSRSKHISKEREYIIYRYIEAGAPAEIAYLAHPHIGSDILRKVVKNLRHRFQEMGGTMLFGTMLTDLEIRNGKVLSALTGSEELAADYFLIAPGHSSYETYRMLMRHGVGFRTKNFALGFRAEHRQEQVNQSQWGIKKLDGIKAAEYRLTSEADGKHPVYSFCMCPGGIVVPATAYKDQNIVNGMSYYQRNGNFANAACVAGMHPDQLAGKTLSALDALQWLEQLEQKFYSFSGGYKAPFCSIKNFLEGTEQKSIPQSSYPLGLIPAPLWTMLPDPVTASLRLGLQDFGRKLRGYEEGILLGLESKTSSLVQVIREQNGLCSGFENLFLIGEGSGYAGGIISSAADGVKVAMNVVNGKW